MMDCDDGTFSAVLGGFPTVRLAAEGFLKDKPEKLTALYGGQATMAYFRRKFGHGALISPVSSYPDAPAAATSTHDGHLAPARE